MITFIKRLFNRPTDAGPTAIQILDPGANLTKMAFAERRAWREEMLLLSVRETFESIGVISCMYKYTVAQLDDRGHYYKIMIDISRDFAVSPNVKINGMVGIEELIANNTFEKYGIVVRGMYWRTNDQINVFTPRSLGIQPPKKTKQPDFADTRPASGQPDMRQAPRHDFDPISDDEAAAFRAALKAGVAPPPVQIGKKTYSTDLMPLTTDL